MKFYASIAIAVCLMGCNSKSSTRPGPVSLEPSRALEPTLTLTQTSLLPGTTAVDPSAALILLRSSDVGKRNTIIDVLTRNASFVSDEGQILAAVPTLSMVKMPPEGMIVSVAPSVTLKPDHWYTFILKQDNDVQLSNGKTLTDLVARTTSTWKNDFFTGSAPHVIRVKTPMGAKDGAYMHVVFSEPIALAQIQASQFVSVDGAPFGKCILSAGTCASSVDGSLAEEFDLAPVGPLGNFSGMTFLVPGSLRGSGRTISEGMALAANRFFVSNGRPGIVEATIAQSEWQPCEQGASRCWQAHNRTP